MANKKISELPYINGGKISGNTLVPLVTYFSATTGDTVHTFVEDFQTYLISGLTGNTDVFVTGGTYSAGTITFTNNTGGTFSVTGVTFSGGSSVSGDYLPLSGGTVTGSTEFTAGLSANTISATTYLNLPITTDVFVTGGTYTNGDATFTNNTGGTFTVTGFYTGETSYVNSLTTGTGLSANTTTGDIIIINTDPDQVVVLNNGTNINVTGTYPNFTIDVTGLTDFNTFTTGFTYSSNTFTITDNSGSTFDATFTDVTGLTVNGDLNITGTTYSNVVSATTYQNLPISGLTEGNNINISGSNGNFTISVTGVTQGVSGDYLPLSGGTVTGNTIFTSGLTATTIGGSGYCVTDLFVSNIHSCSPLYLNPLNEGDIVFGSNSGFTYDITNSSSMTKGNVVGQSDSLSLSSLLSQANSLGLKGSLTLFSHTGATIEYVYNPNVSGYSSIVVGSNISNSKRFEIAYFGSSYVRSSPGNTGANFYQNKSVLRTGSDTNGVVINMDVNGPTSDLWFEQNGNSVMYLHSPGSTGYLGLALNTNGTEKPTSNLQIGGTGTTGTFKYVDGNQQNGYVLTSDAGGNATWQLPTGGGTFTGGTVSGSTQFTNGLTANTISATTYQNLPDNVTGNYLPLSGGTVSGNTTITANLTVSGNSGINWFSSNTSSDLVRITQTGVGNALVVEDNTNPDSSPFIINSGGSVSVGTTSVFSSVGVETKLNVSNGSSGLAITGLSLSTPLVVESSLTSAVGMISPDNQVSEIYFGTPSDTFGSYLRWDYTNRNLILATANSTGKLIFQTANDAEAARIDQNGNMGIGLTGATQKLEVSGNTRIYGSMSADTISATTYQNLPDNVTGRYLPLSGGTVTGNTIFTSGLTANTLNVTGNTNVKAFTGTTGYISGSGQNILTVIGSGNSTTSPLFSVQGSSGELFSVTDSLVGSLFSVNDISGLPIMEVFSDNTTLWGSYQAPSLNTTTRTSLTAGTNTIYSIPTSAYTGAFYEYTLISSGATGARAGQIMSIWSGSTANFTETSTTDIGTTTGVTFTVAVSGNNAVLSSSATTAGWTVKTIIRSI